jgi:hypothetical protein
MSVRNAGITGAATALLACLAAATPAHAADGHAEAVLAEAQALLDDSAPTGQPSEELTLVLGELAAVTPQLEGEDRLTARAILARPDDGLSDRYGDGYTVDEPAESPACSANFCVHWVNSTPDAPNLADSNGTDDGDDVPDVVEETLASADDSFAVENTSLGWTEPLTDGARGGGGAGRTDAYLLDLNTFFGYASPDELQGSATSKYAYLVIDEDMAEFVDDELTALEGLQATMAHEYNHVLQFTYDSQVSRPDLWMLESIATWSEEKVYPAINDYLRYVPTFAANSRTPLTDNTGGLKIYGAAMWNHYLSATEGDAVIRQAWEDILTVTPAHLAVAAYDSALGGLGPSPFDEVGSRFAEFTAASSEWRAQPALFADAAALPDVARSGRLRAGGRAARLQLKHLSYALLKVPADAGSDDLELKVNCPEGVHCGLALVTRDGNATTGVVDSNFVDSPDGGAATVSASAGDYDRITAVVANADASVNNAGRYTSDRSRFRAKLRTG